jgi:hypothetical protein
MTNTGHAWVVVDRQLIFEIRKASDELMLFSLRLDVSNLGC